MLVQMPTVQVQAMYTVKESKCIEQLIADFNDKMICVDMGQTMKDHYRSIADSFPRTSLNMIT